MTTVAEQFVEQRGKLIRAYIMPSRVTFSSAGHKKALRENLDLSAFCSATRPGGHATYMGLPYEISPDQEVDILVGSTCDTPPIPKLGQVTVKLSYDAELGYVLADGKPVGEPINTLELFAKSLSAAQLSDIIMTWLGLDCNWGDFEKALHRAVEEHGSFE